VFDQARDYLAGTIAAWPRGFVHRDYQSRNLMVLPNDNGTHQIGWIDFQDALLGPRVYDLVALLGDSYQAFDEAFIASRLSEFCTEMNLDAAGEAALTREFDLVTVQRKLKDAGRFVFIERTNGNPSFLKFVEPTIAKVRASLTRLGHIPELKALAELLHDLFGRA
jgi:aminoglycoside/choline kinase family phosphotransferase